MENDTLEISEASEAPGIDMTGWSEEDKLAYIAAKQEADDAEQEAAEFVESPAQQAIAAEKQRAERARAETKRAKREKVERLQIDKLRAQYGRKITFFQSKEGLIAVRHPSMNAQFDLQTRVDAIPRKNEKIATVHDAVLELVVFPEKARVKEIEKIFPMILSEVNAQLESDMTGRDYTARPLD
jgi:hypothetical protein